jgi:hypothetical protein
MKIYITWKKTPLYKELGEEEAKKLFKKAGLKIFLMWEYYLIVAMGIPFALFINFLITAAGSFNSMLKGAIIGGTMGLFFGCLFTTLSYRYLIKNKLYVEKSAQQSDTPETMA